MPGSQLESATRERKIEAANRPEDGVAELVEFLLGRRFEDHLSPVFASSNCFRETGSGNDAEWVAWLSLAEFKEVGDKRSARLGRLFPVPRLAFNLENYFRGTEQVVYTTELSAHWENGVIRHGTEGDRFIQPVSPAGDSTVLQIAELLDHELPGYLRTAIREMEAEFDL